MKFKFLKKFWKRHFGEDSIWSNKNPYAHGDEDTEEGRKKYGIRNFGLGG